MRTRVQEIDMAVACTCNVHTHCPGCNSGGRFSQRASARKTGRSVTAAGPGPVSFGGNSRYPFVSFHLSSSQSFSSLLVGYGLAMTLMPSENYARASRSTQIYTRSPAHPFQEWPTCRASSFRLYASSTVRVLLSHE